MRGLAVALLAGLTACQPAEQPAVKDAWVRALPPGVAVTAGYLSFVNPTDSDIVLLSAASPEFGRVEFHVTRMRDDVARMEREPQIVVPAGGKVTLEPGGRHLMLFDPASHIGPDSTVTLRFETESGLKLSVTADVRSGSGRDHRH